MILAQDRITEDEFKSDGYVLGEVKWFDPVGRRYGFVCVTEEDGSTTEVMMHVNHVPERIWPELRRRGRIIAIQVEAKWNDPKSLEVTNVKFMKPRSL